MSKTLDVKNTDDLKGKVNDVEVVGDPDVWTLICKASSKSQGWMKSTKAMQIDRAGCLVQVTTQQGEHVAESLSFIPGAEIKTDSRGNHYLIGWDE